MASRRNVRGYAPLPTEDRDDSNLTDDVDLRFTYTPKSLRKIPWKSIALALFLLLLGCSLLFLSYFIFTGHMEGDNSQAYGLLFLGILAFLPGMLMYTGLPYIFTLVMELFNLLNESFSPIIY
ncbi:hypothetical protein E2562_034353 [Oryza meyeriana var. granulata]|uniref:Uncharacterized protein n=1 Tax=Oryza meyeriana var. granulata TaxID=110450 RepID=A0A6G1ECS2_9ORYZ|nr:hypothetical protein E2562_034353 [Oryza meyeriana var. granulata]